MHSLLYKFDVNAGEHFSQLFLHQPVIIVHLACWCFWNNTCCLHCRQTAIEVTCVKACRWFCTWWCRSKVTCDTIWWCTLPCFCVEYMYVTCDHACRWCTCAWSSLFLIGVTCPRAGMFCISTVCNKIIIITVLQKVNIEEIHVFSLHVSKTHNLQSWKLCVLL